MPSYKWVGCWSPKYGIPVPKCCYDLGQFLQKCLVKHSNVKGSVELGFQVLDLEIDRVINKDPNFKFLLDPADKNQIKANIAADLMLNNPNKISSRLIPTIDNFIQSYYSQKLNAIMATGQISLLGQSSIYEDSITNNGRESFTELDLDSQGGPPPGAQTMLLHDNTVVLGATPQTSFEASQL